MKRINASKSSEHYGCSVTWTRALTGSAVGASALLSAQQYAHIQADMTCQLLASAVAAAAGAVIRLMPKQTCRVKYQVHIWDKNCF
jgi:hypothetical protein